MSKILLTGATGLIGNQLIPYLKKNNHQIVFLSRNKSDQAKNIFKWDVSNNFIADDVFEGVEYIIHLAGAGIADKRWTEKRKKEIFDSRVKSAELLFNKVNKNKIQLKAFISASATGYYGTVTNDKIYKEKDTLGNDFLSDVCIKWETAALQFEGIGVRTVRLRFGVVLSEKGGALKKMLLPTKLGFGSALGSGKQFLPWIHIDDLIGIIAKSVSDESMKGVYNAVAPSFTNYNEFAKTLAEVINKPFFMPNVPSFALKLIFGEMSKVILEGSRISCQKLIDAGYNFNFPNLEEALIDLLIPPLKK
ncbi:MAG: TIGR01777 family protein [Ignavibacteriales bacterium]|nr:TIGR01777 family protein [Ignavibacteriales bacterium]